MNEYLIYITIGVLSLLIGWIMSRMIFKLKSDNLKKDYRNDINLWENKYNNAVNLLTDFKRESGETLEKLKDELNGRIEEVEGERNELRGEKSNLEIQLERKNSDYEHLEEKLNEHQQQVEKLEEKFEKEFENLANRILDQKSEKFLHLNRENLDQILKPLQDRIKGFEEKVEKSGKESVARHAQLGEQLRHLKEQNLKIGEEANNLVRALKGEAKMQGNWGELILERVLEKSGLTKDNEYFVQQSFTTDTGRRLQPDVVIYLPGERKMIVDSKVSLTAYERYVNATEEREKEEYLKDHLLSVKRHIEELSQKNYQRLYEMESPDFVLLFIPIEAAFAVASNENPGLYGEAFDKNIILVTPTTLLAVLRTIENMWQNEKQTQNAIEIATQAGRLYDSFVNLIEDFEKVGRQMQTVQNSYETAMKKLTGRGNLIRRVENLKELGAKASKQIEQRLIENTEENE